MVVEEEEEEEAIAGVVGMTEVVAAAEALEPRARWKRGLETGTVHRKFCFVFFFRLKYDI